jgi:hypothetical protein
VAFTKIQAANKVGVAGCVCWMSSVRVCLCVCGGRGLGTARAVARWSLAPRATATTVPSVLVPRAGVHISLVSCTHTTPNTQHTRVQDGILGMVLDLSNSDKYYDPSEFTNNGIRYIKVGMGAPCEQPACPAGINKLSTAQHSTAHVLGLTSSTSHRRPLTPPPMAHARPDAGALQGPRAVAQPARRQHGCVGDPQGHRS